MKNLTIFFFIFLGVVNAQSKSGRIYYDVIMPEFDYNKAAKGEFGANSVQLLKETSALSKQLKYVLQFDKLGSKYSRADLLSVDFNNVNPTVLRLTDTKLSGGFDYYYKTNERKAYQYKNGILVESRTLKWSVTNDTKKIDAYECFKAIGFYESLDRYGEMQSWEVEAWFAPSIPLPYGPKFYNGLPGLILELTEKSSNIIYGINSVEFTSPDKSGINFPKGEILTFEEYSKKMLKGSDPSVIKELQRKKQ